MGKMKLIDAGRLKQMFDGKECFQTDAKGIRQLLDDAPEVEAVPRDLIDKAILEIKQLQKQEDMGIGYYNPPFYCERCLMILEAIIEGGQNVRDSKY